MIICELNSKGEYRIISFERSEYGDDYNKFVKRKFPEKIWDKALAENNYYPENLWMKVFDEKGYFIKLENEKEKQAKEHLQSINSDARIE